MTIYWGCMQQCIMKTESVDSLGQQFLDLLDQASWCHVGMARSLGLQRSAMGCCRHWCQGILLNSWCGKNSWVASVADAANVGCMCGAGGGDAGCATKKQGLIRACGVAVVPLGTVSVALTLHSQRCLHMQQYVENHCRCILDSYFCGRMHITVAGTQIFWRVSYVATSWPAYSGASVLLHLSACALADSECASICSWTCGAAGLLLCILAGMVVLSWGWYNSSAGDGSLVLIGVARSASKARCGSALLYLAHWECMFHGLDACFSKSIGLWVMQTWGFRCDAPRCTEVGKLGTHILRAIVRAKDSRDAMLWKHLLQQWDDLVGITLARWKTLIQDHLQVEVTYNQVVNSFKCEDICGTHLL